MKAKAPQAQGMKWMKRCKRRAKAWARESAAWGEANEADARAETTTATATTTTTSALDRALQSGKKRNKGKAKKKESYAVSAASTVSGGVSKKRDGGKRGESTSAPKYASGNPFAALAMARKR
jgi:hypothetical protein